MKTQRFFINPFFRKSAYLIAIGLLVNLTLSCSNDDDGFVEANGDVEAKYIEKIITVGESFVETIDVTYDEDGKVVLITDGEEGQYFNYNENNGNLEEITNNSDNLLIGDIIGEIHNAYEIGDVLEFDSYGNPTVIELYDAEIVDETSIATITYDNKPFSFYYTLDAAGIIDVLYDVRLQFYAPPEIIIARELLPVHNPVRAVITNTITQETYTLIADYEYGEGDYPSSAQLYQIEEDGYVSEAEASYFYR